MFKVADVFRERFPPAWGFLGFRDAIALEMLLFAEETPDAASDWVGRWRILISPRNFFFNSFVC